MRGARRDPRPYRDRLERVLEPGRHRLFDPRHELSAEVFGVVRAEYPADRYAVLKAARPDLAAELFEAVETHANEVASSASTAVPCS